MNKETILSVRNLQIEVDTQALVNGVSFDIHQGEIFALVGESGSGKSLTALAIMRLLPEALCISGGAITFKDTALFKLTEMQMNRVRGKKIAMIFQEPQTSLNPVQTIGDQLKEVLKLHQNLTPQETQQKLINMLEEVGIPDPEDRLKWYPHQLSGGQKQRVMIAMALACEPDLLIADEPTTALDVTIQRQILELLDKLRHDRQLSVLLITHDMGIVNEMADHIAVMQHGDILEQAETKAFFENPQHEYSKRLIHSLPKRDDFFKVDSKEALLKVDNLKVWFAQKKGILQRTVGHTKAVNGISFTVGKGETLAIVGESGSGKTTAGKAIIRLNPIHSGNVSFNGEAISGLNHKAFLPYRRRVQIIFQDPFSSMNPRMSIREIIEEGMKSLGIESDTKKREQKMRTLLERVGLNAEHLDRYPHEFSGGQRQRIAIARALAVDPELIICDEPTSALDVSIRGQVLDLLRELQNEFGISYLFITHDLSIIPHLAHRVAVMQNGEIVEQGTAKQIMTEPTHPYTKTLLEAVPKLHNQVAP
ncbi:ABC transporter ATP-binding protein [Bermanella marisrubri]|uniref:ABC transporter related protein n=1 Tax=Bermanella marisrubri TaxID=207949 RepID=Q1N1H3_9GAMM|nr:dipeptide ABC transporter ATP-binding protein [Bermanella marisrubri]EAT12077.1 ABC transporter related protein [Oceanobacter sp. RED65] [Bermanella marisrubri]QIZ83543.1 ABC transporter ATP-binding protein [Bermanella marisrubri]